MQGSVGEPSFASLVLDRVEHGATEILAGHSSFDEVVLGSRLHCSDRAGLVIVSSDHDDGRLRADAS